MTERPDPARFSQPRLRWRQMIELLGLCRGLIADGKINQDEAEALHAWLVGQRDFREPHVGALKARVAGMLEDGVLDADESAELMRLACDLINHHSATDVSEAAVRYQPSRLEDHQMSSLVGLCRGLIGDGKINRNEADALHTWLLAHARTIGHPVLAELRGRLCALAAPGSPDRPDFPKLAGLLRELVGPRPEVGECLMPTAFLLDDPPPEISCEGRKFCFTGKFMYGTRRACEAAVRERGGVRQTNPSKSTDYVVIGSYAEDAWIQSLFGRKIEAAVELRAAGHPVKIVAEAHWSAELGA